MDRQIENREASAETRRAKPPYRSRHLMCRTPIWGVAGLLGCGYFAWISFSRVAHHEYDWPHDLWTAATYIVWILLLLGLALDTRCLRERVFFGALVLNFLAGCLLTLWYSVAPATVRSARIGTGVLWTLAALASLTTLRGASDSRGRG
jgi:hypothetical protein